MNRLEAVIEKEKEISYSQRDKDVFSSHLLILIHQEQESKRFHRKLWLGFFSFIGIMSFSFSAINEIVNDFAVGFSNVMAGDLTTVLALSYIVNDLAVGFSNVMAGDLTTVLAFSCTMSFALLAVLKKADFIFN